MSKLLFFTALILAPLFAVAADFDFVAYPVLHRLQCAKNLSVSQVRRVCEVALLHTNGIYFSMETENSVHLFKEFDHSETKDDQGRSVRVSLVKHVGNLVHGNFEPVLVGDEQKPGLISIWREPKTPVITSMIGDIHGLGHLSTGRFESIIHQ